MEDTKLVDVEFYSNLHTVKGAYEALLSKVNYDTLMDMHITVRSNMLTLKRTAHAYGSDACVDVDSLVQMTIGAQKLLRLSDVDFHREDLDEAFTRYLSEINQAGQIVTQATDRGKIDMRFAEGSSAVVGAGYISRLWEVEETYLEAKKCARFDNVQKLRIACREALAELDSYTRSLNKYSADMDSLEIICEQAMQWCRPNRVNKQRVKVYHSFKRYLTEIRNARKIVSQSEPQYCINVF